VLIDAIRGLVLDQPDVSVIWQSLAWSIGLLAVFIPLAVWAYGRRIMRLRSRLASDGTHRQATSAAQPPS